MTIETVFEEEWSEDAGAYVPTENILGFRAVGGDGTVYGWGDSPDEASETALRTVWRV